MNFIQNIGLSLLLVPFLQYGAQMPSNKKIVYFYDSIDMFSSKPKLEETEKTMITEIKPYEFFKNREKNDALNSLLKQGETIDILAITGGHSNQTDVENRSLWNQDIQNDFKPNILDKMEARNNKANVIFLTSCFSSALIPEFSNILLEDGIILAHSLISNAHYFVDNSIPVLDNTERIKNIIRELNTINNANKPIDFKWLEEQGAIRYWPTPEVLSTKILFDFSSKINALNISSQEKEELQEKLLSLAPTSSQIQIFDLVNMTTKHITLNKTLLANQHKVENVLTFKDNTGTITINSLLPCTNQKDGESDCCIVLNDEPLCANSAISLKEDFQLDIFASDQNIKTFLEILVALGITKAPQQFVLYDNKTKKLYYDKNFLAENNPASLAPYLADTNSDKSLEQEFKELLKTITEAAEINNIKNFKTQAIEPEELLQKIETCLNNLIS